MRNGGGTTEGFSRRGGVLAGSSKELAAFGASGGIQLFRERWGRASDPQRCGSSGSGWRVISPVLANLYLNPLDQRVVKRTMWPGTGCGMISLLRRDFVIALAPLGQAPAVFIRAIL